MIVVQDRIEVDACRLHQLQELFHQRYLEAATARGLEYIDATVSPPVKLTREPVVLSLRWQVADAPAWWAMRAQSMQPAVAAFWNEVDALCHRRERTYLVAADAVSATGPGQDVSGFRIGVRGHRETAQLRLRDGLTTIDIETMTVTLEQAAAQLSTQMQMLVSKGLYMSTIPVDVSQRNWRDRDENIQALNDRLSREKLDNQHQLYQQQFGMRTRLLDGQSQLHAVRQEVLKYQASLISGMYELLQNIRNRILAGKQAILAARDANARLGIEVNSTLLQQLQTAFTGVLGGKERFASLLMQNANTLAEHKHRAVVEKMNTAAQRLDGWKSVAAENRALMAYQLDERNKLLIGLYSFVERRDDVAPEWKDMSTMIASLADSGGGWVTP